MTIEQDFPPRIRLYNADDLSGKYGDICARALAMERALRRVAELPTDQGIGTIMLATIVAEARHALNLTKP